MTNDPHAESDAALLRSILGGQGGSSATINVRQDSLIAICVGVSCAFLVAFAVIVSVACVVIVAVMRDQDLRDMAQIRARLMQCEQYREQHTRRLNQLEATQNDSQKESESQ